MPELDNHIALVTGATRGLGYATALALARRGAHVIALGRTVGGLEDLDDEISAAGGAATLAPLDLGDDPGLERLAAAVHQRWGRLDILVHCAAEAAPMAPAEHIAASDLDKAIAANFRMVQRLIRVIDPLLKTAPAPQAVFIDDPATSGARFQGAYGAAKAAARALVLSWAAEQARRGPRIWLAAPPPMPTAIRARSHPGQAAESLTSCRVVAEALVEKIAGNDAAPGEAITL
ncbi:MAG: SDR family NAD(P)-dependent oxidoreductase [Paracoccaceae bacterium]